MNQKLKSIKLQCPIHKISASYLCFTTECNAQYRVVCTSCLSEGAIHNPTHNFIQISEVFDKLNINFKNQQQQLKQKLNEVKQNLKEQIKKIIDQAKVDIEFQLYSIKDIYEKQIDLLDMKSFNGEFQTDSYKKLEQLLKNPFNIQDDIQNPQKFVFLSEQIDRYDEKQAVSQTIFNPIQDRFSNNYKLIQDTVKNICKSELMPISKFTLPDLDQEEKANKDAKRHMENFRMAEKSQLEETFTLINFQGKKAEELEGCSYTTLKLAVDQFATGQFQDINIWQKSKQKPISVLKGHRSIIWSLANINQEIIASGSQDLTVRIWNWKLATCLLLFQEHKDSIIALTVLDYDTLASGSSDGQLFIWQWQDAKIKKSIQKAHDSLWASMLVNNDKQQLVITCGGNEVKSWNPLGWTSEYTQKIEDKPLSLAEISIDLIAVGAQSGKLWILRTSNLEKQKILSAQQTSIYKIISCDSRTIVTCGYKDNVAKMWNWKEGRCIKQLPVLGDQFQGLCWLNGNTIITGTVSPDKIIMWE